MMDVIEVGTGKLHAMYNYPYTISWRGQVEQWVTTYCGIEKPLTAVRVNDAARAGFLEIVPA